MPFCVRKSRWQTRLLRLLMLLRLTLSERKFEDIVKQLD
jgi:hypothetical protein